MFSDWSVHSQGNWLTFGDSAARPEISLLVTEGDLFIRSSLTFPWLLLAEGLGIDMSCWWLILSPEYYPGRAGLSGGLSWVLAQVSGEKHEATECRKRREKYRKGSWDQGWAWG